MQHRHVLHSLCSCVQDLPPTLLPYLRLAHCDSKEELKKHAAAFTTGSLPLAEDQEAQVLQNLTSCLQRRLNRFASCSHSLTK